MVGIKLLRIFFGQAVQEGVKLGTKSSAAQSQGGRWEGGSGHGGLSGQV